MPSPFLIAGEWVNSGDAVQIRSPYDGSVVGETCWAGPRELERAITVAAANRHELQRLDDAERSTICRKISAAIRGRFEEFARTIALEAGKPMKSAHVEVERAIFTFALAADEALKVEERIDVSLPAPQPARKGRVRKFPAGPVAAITPFNFPLNLVAHKLAPAIAVGCPVVLKPAPQTPLTALLLARLIVDAGLPKSALSVLPLRNEHATPLVADDRISVLSFTGSAAVGWDLKKRAGKKRVLLELGGNAAVIVHSDADLERAATQCAVGGFSYAGQSCISVQRILVAKEKHGEFIERLIPKVKALKCGDPLDEQVDVGPLIRESDAVRVEEWIAEAVRGGARVLCGGKRSGSLVEPAVLTGTRPEQKVNCEEAFGPLVTVEPYATFAAAISTANATRYGLQAGIFTNDQVLIERAFRELEVGGVIVNDVPTFRSDAMPYGGIKDSGLGREGVRYAIAEMSDLKVLVQP